MEKAAPGGAAFFVGFFCCKQINLLSNLKTFVNEKKAYLYLALAITGVS